MNHSAPDMACLTLADVDKLRALKPGELQVTRIDIWVSRMKSDIHYCVIAEINGTKVSFWWLTIQEIAAFYYPDSMAAQQQIVQLIDAGSRE